MLFHFVIHWLLNMISEKIRRVFEADPVAYYHTNKQSVPSRHGRGGIRTLDLRCVRAMSKTRLDDSPDYTNSIIYFTFVLEITRLLLDAKCSVLKSQLTTSALPASCGIDVVLCTTREADLKKQSAVLCDLLLERICYWHTTAYSMVIYFYLSIFQATGFCFSFSAKSTGSSAGLLATGTSAFANILTFDSAEPKLPYMIAPA